MFQPVLNAAMAVLGRRHPGIFDRLSIDDPPVYLIDPIDLPYIFLLATDPNAPKLVAKHSDYSCEVTATIRGPLIRLLEMLEGRIDGDALFFSRELAIEGDTEAVVALRNAIDDAEIDLKSDLLSLFGHFSVPVSSLVDKAERVAGCASRDLETLRQAALMPSIRRLDRQDRRLNEMASKLDGTLDNGKKRRKTRS